MVGPVSFDRLGRRSPSDFGEPLKHRHPGHLAPVVKPDAAKWSLVSLVVRMIEISCILGAGRLTFFLFLRGALLPRYQEPLETRRSCGLPGARLCGDEALQR